MDIVTMRQTMMNAIMMVVIVVQILTWLATASVTTKQTILNVTLMVETVVSNHICIFHQEFVMNLIAPFYTMQIMLMLSLCVHNI